MKGLNVDEIQELTDFIIQEREEYAEHQNKELIIKAGKLMLKHLGFTEDGGIIAKEQLKIFKILDELKK